MSRTLTVAEMMRTPIKALREDDSLSIAEWEMHVAQIRHLPVVDLGGKLVGMLSDRDVLRAAAEGLLNGGLARVGSLMTRGVGTATPETPALVAVEQLLEHKYGALPVVDVSGKPVGIVTSTDFLEIAHRALSGLDPTATHVRA